MILVPDTNIVLPDYTLTAPGSQLILRHMRALNVEVCVPEVVIDEICGRAERSITEPFAAAEKKIRDVFGETVPRPLTSVLHGPRQQQIESAIGRYRSFIIEQLDEDSVSTTPYPNVDHADLVR